MDTVYEEESFQVSILDDCRDGKLKNDFLKIRTSIWRKPGWEIVPEGQFELDRFDPTAAVLVVAHTGTVIGGFRLITAPVEELPFFEYCERKPADKGPTVEISRWCVSPEVQKSVRAKAHRVMMKGVLAHFLSSEVSDSYMDVCSFLFKSLGQSGMVMKPLGREHYRPDGTGFVPAVLDVFASATNLGLLETRACA